MARARRAGRRRAGRSRRGVSKSSAASRPDDRAALPAGEHEPEIAGALGQRLEHLSQLGRDLHVLDERDFDAAIADAATTGLASDDSFAELVGHLARVHPSRYIRIIEGLSAVGLRDVEQLTDQSAALRFVAFIDRVYDAELPIRATGLSLDLVFPGEMLAGGYRKKYLRAISRLVASTLA